MPELSGVRPPPVAEVRPQKQLKLQTDYELVLARVAPVLRRARPNLAAVCEADPDERHRAGDR